MFGKAEYKITKIVIIFFLMQINIPNLLKDNYYLSFSVKAGDVNVMDTEQEIKNARSSLKAIRN